ncbi:hypothetical protein I3842_13G122600 [Carya illinoinensis]|uniref:Ribosomal protein S2 n=1 Tax=Carya illinoinensis TaxID=32201 RepID=A0A922ANW4_CARIL|nr:hypothetical protein I3842_13G122600 [Carya illinoinensis]
MTKKIELYNPNQNWWVPHQQSQPHEVPLSQQEALLLPPQPPDCIVILDTERKSSVVLEADKLQIPVVALVDSTMLLDIYKRIAYPVPANDSVQFVYLFCNLITKIFLLEQKKAITSWLQRGTDSGRRTVRGLEEFDLPGSLEPSDRTALEAETKYSPCFNPTKTFRNLRSTSPIAWWPKALLLGF